jgi:cell division transport system permease protein
VNAGLSYSITEGLKGLRRAKFSTFVSISTIFLSLVLIGIFIIFILNVQRVVTQIQSRMELEVFIDNSYTVTQAENLRQRILHINGIDSARYVSKEEALEIINRQLSQNILEILDENPLPSSFQVKLKPRFRSAAIAQQISAQLRQLEGVDEVFYRQDLLIILEKYMRIFMIGVLGIGLLLGAGAMFLVSNTIKLIIFSRSNVIEIMKLVGATRRFIRRPFVIEGIIQGLIGGLLAALFFYLILKVVKLEIPGLILIDQKSYPFLIILGIIFGFIGSLFALRKFLRY